MLNVSMSEGITSDTETTEQIIPRKPPQMAKIGPKKAEMEGILKQITQLYEIPLKTLKERYQALFPEARAPSNKEFLIRHIAYKLQEDVFGTLSEPAKQQLNTLKTELNPLKTLGQKPAQSGQAKTSHRIPIPGTIITKIYKGRTLQVKVLQKGFEYEGKPYRTLSSLARKISGVPQSGFVFFFGR